MVVCKLVFIRRVVYLLSALLVQVWDSIQVATPPLPFSLPCALPENILFYYSLPIIRSSISHFFPILSSLVIFVLLACHVFHSMRVTNVTTSFVPALSTDALAIDSSHGSPQRHNSRPDSGPMLYQLRLQTDPEPKTNISVSTKCVKHSFWTGQMVMPTVYFAEQHAHVNICWSHDEHSIVSIFHTSINKYSAFSCSL